MYRTTTHQRTGTKAANLLAALALLFSLTLFPSMAHAVTAGIVDDDFTLAAARSDNMGAYTSSDSAFNADNTVITRSDTNPGWISWTLDEDVKSISISSYFWVHGSGHALKIQTSTDGQTWTDATGVTSREFGNESAPDWPTVVHEVSVTTPGVRHVRVELSGSAEGGGWGIQIARAHINSRVLMVSSTPTAPGRIDGPTEVSLATATADAEIRYTINGGAEQVYTAPFTVDSKTSIRAWATATDLVASVPVSLNFSSAADITVDRYGQLVGYDWPQRVTSDEQLAADVAADDAWYGSFTPEQRDSYGGDPGSGERLGLESTGWFHLDTTSDGRKTIVTPDGNQYFSLGLNVFGSVGDTYTQVNGREELYEYLPTSSDDPLSAGWLGGTEGQNYSFYVANQVRKYGSWDPAAYWSRQVDRATSLGFTTAGGFSNLGHRATNPFPYVAHVDSVPSHPIGWTNLYDVFAPGLQEELNQAMVNNVAPYKDDPYLVGYMFFNEVSWTSLRTAVSQSAASEVASKGVLVDMLQERHGTIEAFNAAWAMEAESFDALREMSFTPRTDAAVTDIDAFSAVFMDRFYEVFSTAIRNADPNHMVLGDRWFGNVIANDKLRDQLATAAGKYLDVITYNYYTWDLDFSRIDAIYEKSGGTPMIFTEFHYGDPTRGLTFAIRMGENEQDKGLLYRNYVEKAAASGGKVVGAHWFEYLDQAATGRWFQGYEGEAGAIGLLDVADRPYKTFQQLVSQANGAVYDLMDGTKDPYQYAFSESQTERENNKTTNIPKAPTSIVVDGALDASWPEGETLSLTSTDLINGVAKEGVEGRFRLAWDDQFLYVHADISDDTPMLNPKNGFDIWDGDAVELFVGPRNVDQGGGIQISDTQIILSAQPTDENGSIQYYWYNERPDQPVIDGVVKPSEAGYTLEAAIALSDLGLAGATAPQTIRFDIGFDDGNGKSRQRQFMWNGVEGNAHNRESWGRAVLVASAVTPTPTPTPTPTKQCGRPSDKPTPPGNPTPPCGRPTDKPTPPRGRPTDKPMPPKANPKARATAAPSIVQPTATPTS